MIGPPPLLPEIQLTELVLHHALHDALRSIDLKKSLVSMRVCGDSENAMTGTVFVVGVLMHGSVDETVIHNVGIGPLSEPGGRVIRACGPFSSLLGE